MSDGYSRLSIILHWLAAILIIVLFVTHEDDALNFHIALGAIVGPLLLWRAIRRPFKRMPPKPVQPPLLNFLSTIVLWVLILSIITVVITGYLAPWSVGQPIDIWVGSLPSPMSANRNVHEFMEELHDISGHAFLPLLLLHIAGAIKHWKFDVQNTTKRIFMPKAGGH